VGLTFPEYAAISKAVETEETEEGYWKMEKDYWAFVEN
jgi:hypothetical protein